MPQKEESALEPEYITRAEHEEFRKRIEAEDRRQNRRIELLEKSIEQQKTLTTSVEKLAVNMENMLREQKQQGERLETLENRDGEKWRNVTGYIITFVIGLVVSYIFSMIGV